MSSGDELIADAGRRMSQSVEVLSQSLQAMRTGRPSPELIEDLAVNCYGASLPLKQLAGITVEEGRSLLVQVWDKEIVSEVDRAIRASPLGLNPVSAGEVLRVALPSLSEEMRRKLVRQAGAEAEKARIAVRNVRRDCLAKFRAQEDTGKDEEHSFQGQIQKTTDKYIAEIDALLQSKEQSLMQH